jgi:hypothetical protein
VIDVVYDATIPYDIRFFQSLNRIVQTEPWLLRDKAMIDQLKSIGIEKGKPFNPDAKARDALDAGIRGAHAWLENYYETSYFPAAFNEGGHWFVPASPAFAQALQTSFADPNTYPVDDRGTAYSLAFFSAKHFGAGQYYLMTFSDKGGYALDGKSTYSLSVSAKAPVTQYWSATAYDRATHALIRNMPSASRSSQSARLQKNVDGSVDIFFGPKAPKGKESNWVPTSADGRFEVLFRFYGPKKALFDKTWRLTDIVKVENH